ncbi:MAG: hypothetical protein IPN42_05660 [Methylococcaceae bacterium]|nr:hypothetical protein [Methylococcaceae bacterium]
MGATAKYHNQINKERSIAPFVPYSSQISDNTIVTDDGDYLRIWRVGGTSFETIDIEDIALRKEQLNTLYRAIGSNKVAIWTHTIRRRITDKLNATYDNKFARDFNEKYYESFSGYRMMANELYLTVIYRPQPTRTEKLFTKASRRSLEEILNDQKAAIKKLDEIAYQVESSMARYYQVEQLSTYQDEQGVKYSQALELINYLISGEWQRVRVPKAPLNEYLGSAWIFVGTETIEIRSPTKTRYAQCIDFKDYNAHTEVAALVTTATDAAFYAQLPCNWRYRPRIAGLTSRNFAGLACFHNFTAGKRDGNPWGQAVTLVKTTSGQPLYINFHHSKGDEDNYDKKVLGNTRIIGQSGSGKTVLMNMLFLQAQKFKINAPLGFTSIFFDKDEGAKLCIKAMGGKYLSVKNGQPTGFNPFQMESTEENIQFLDRLLRVLVAHGGKAISTTDELQISHAVRTVMKMDKEDRRLSIVLQNIPVGITKEDKENSVHKRLSKWCYDDGSGVKGAYAWVLDCPKDEIDFTVYDNYGIDGTDFLDNADVRTPVSMYLLHRMESIIDGRRFIYWMDEAWKWVDDEAFAEFAGNKQVTIRKQNGLGVFATQMPSSLLNSKIAKSLVQQVATEIYLPNPKADYKEYVEEFKTSVAEYDLIRSLHEDSHMFLIKQGHQSMIGHLDLNGFDDELAIMSGSSDNNELLDEIIKEVGDNPDEWIPVFQERRKERVLASKLKKTR